MDFHDGIIRRLELDATTCDIIVLISAYSSEDSSERSEFEFTFSGVSFFALVADLGEVKRNEFAGTIVSIREDADKITNIYLTGGIFTVKSAIRTVRNMSNS